MKKLLYEEILKQRHDEQSVKSAVRSNFSLILDNIRSLHNVGSIFRTSDAAMVEKLLLCGFTPHPPRKELDKTALGATETVPWQYFQTTEEAIISEKNQGKKIIALELTDEKRNYTDLKLSDFPASFVLGNELSGISNEALALCDSSVEIPMLGLKHSLNVSVATGIIIFEALRVSVYKKDL
jgi:23S rRNA (guanosine2251-2'-O)-methyltransferase